MTTTDETTRRADTLTDERVLELRAAFPILEREVHGHPLIYIDNAATTQKPLVVLDAIDGFYRRANANVHRGIHQLSVDATNAYEGARAKVRRLINAAEDAEIIFTRGTTESINLVAAAYGNTAVGPGDEVLVTHMEHHSNIVPWQLLCARTGASLRVVPVTDTGELDLDAFAELLGARTRIVAIGHVSNALGTINPVREMTAAARGRGAVVVLDGAQAVAHGEVDVQAIGCDFYALSGHKMYGPTGIGVLYGRRELLEGMEPYQGGGEMIRSVSFEEVTYNDVPHKFEAGTPNIAGAVGLGAAADFLDEVGRAAIAAHEARLLAAATAALRDVPDLRIIGTGPRKTAIVSFVIEGIHPHDLGTVLDHDGIAIRAGHHCAQPLMDRFGVPATARASFALYNTADEVVALAEAIRRAVRMFRP